MKRNFRVQEIDYRGFNALCKRLRLRSDDGFANGGSKKYVQLRDTEEITLDRILQDLDADKQKLKCIMVPKGNIDVREATARTLRKREAYFKGLRDYEKDYNRLVVQYSRRLNAKNVDHTLDTFEYWKEKGVWRLRRAHISKRNYGLYRFEGLSGLTKATPALLGVHV